MKETTHAPSRARRIASDVMASLLFTVVMVIAVSLFAVAAAIVAAGCALIAAPIVLTAVGLTRPWPLLLYLLLATAIYLFYATRDSGKEEKPSTEQTSESTTTPVED